MIYVLPNPSHALDHKGRPACAVSTEGALTWIGARLDAEASAKEGAAVFVFDTEPVAIGETLTPYYARMIEEGALLLVDAPKPAGPDVARAITRLDPPADS